MRSFRNSGVRAYSDVESILQPTRAPDSRMATLICFSSIYFPDFFSVTDLSRAPLQIASAFAAQVPHRPQLQTYLNTNMFTVVGPQTALLANPSQLHILQ